MRRSQSAQASSDNNGFPGCTQNSGPAAHRGVGHRSSARFALNHRIRTACPEKVRSHSVQCRCSSQSVQVWCGSSRRRMERRLESEAGERRMGIGQNREALKIVELYSWTGGWRSSQGHRENAGRTRRHLGSRACASGKRRSEKAKKTTGLEERNVQVMAFTLSRKARRAIGRLPVAGERDLPNWLAPAPPQR